MSTLSIDNFRHETRFVFRISTRDVAKRLAALAMILVLCWSAGSRVSVIVVVALILACEVSAQIAARLDVAPDVDVPLWLAVWMWLTNIPSTLFYMAPAAFLVGQPEMPLVLCGFLWVFGVYVHISNNFMALPFYNWSQMIPAFVAGLGIVWLAAATHGGFDAPILWVVVAGLFAVYGGNTIETMTTQKQFMRELAQARADAKDRLKAIEHLARHDALTGLASRQAFDDGLDRMLAHRKAGQSVAVLLMDLDGFKPINDTYSHAAGDAVLMAVGRRLRALAGAEGIAARLGGDEFALALPDLDSGRAALALAAEIICQVERPIAFGEKTLRISGSIGVGLSGALVAGTPGTGDPRAAEDGVTALCAQADQAMYRAKLAAQTGSRSRAVLYDPADFPPRPSLGDRLRLADAIAARDIGPLYQPIVDFATGRAMGFEALARWDHPTQGSLLPSAFLPLVGEFGLQGDFLTAMADQVLRDTAALVAEGFDPGRVSFNIPEVALATHSGRQDLDGIIARWPAARPHIVFEITEDVFIARAAEMIQESIAHFRAQGIGVALDDFGTGFGSFQHLRSLEFDELKIDTSFVTDLGRDPTAEIVVGGFVTMGLGLGMRLIAEGVETEDQRRHLIRLGCSFGQGFLFGRAMPLSEVRAVLAREAGATLRLDGAA